ncbi:hypothetical protein [Mycobacterium sp. 852002-51057_SCH5723018]|uniref:DUF7159 family protein n=1 Tax=Mycobacterium sp. 852002-51057_SCH5723018 TaxID=1834094 RepID=UPI0007FE16E8|nr:hypothetical protein [Mycobacterium sp. 852002-51057_SCH5723018]OBG18759.1 hypothetical protein A5764_18375 [Mycobacterium sp. 852002-51057_SCH5723018]
MDTVLGLSLTPTTVGWVLAEGHDADGTILDHQEMGVRAGRGVPAVSTAGQVTDEVLRVDALAAASDHHLRLVGLTWSDDAAAQAALVVEALTDAGFDNVVPVRLLDAVETLAEAIAPVIGYQQTAVCVLEHESATVVMVDTREGETQTATKQVRGGLDGLSCWLRGMFDRDGWRPGGVVVVGPDSEINGFSWQLEKALPVPVFAQTMAQVTIARGAALAAASSTEFTDDQLVAHVSEPAAAPASSPPRKLSYAGAAVAAGAITFVSSLALAVGIQLGPASAPSPAKHVVHAPAPQVAEAVAPAVAPPPEATPPARPSKAPTSEPAPDAATAADQDGAGGEQQSDPNARQPYLTRVLEHIPGDAGDSAHSPTP